MPAIAPPASSAPPGVTIVDTGPPAAPPAPTTSIAVSSIPAPAAPAKPPAKGSAMDRLRQDLAKKAKTPGEPAPTQSPTTPAPQSPSPEGTTAPASGEPDPGSTPPEPGSPPSTPTPEGDKTKGKANPWKLVDQFKGRVAELEKQIAEGKAITLAEQQRKEFADQIASLNKRNEDLENEMRFVNYGKSKEFQEKYQAPYESAWKRAVSELAEITVTDPQTSATRAASPEDLLTLVNLPLGKAREVANTLFGDFADDVMAHRKELRGLFDAQQVALEEAKKNGGEREKQMMEAHQRQLTETQEFIKKTWEASNAEVLSSTKLSRFFSPVEGDEEGNARLAKGYALADKAFAENPLDPKLTPEQRATAVKRHVALRNRAAAFGRLVDTVEKLEAKNAELTKKLQEIQGTTPSTGGLQPPAPQSPVYTSAHDAIFAALRAKAK